MNTLKDFVNWKLTHADKVAEAEGYPLVMENCKKYKKMKQLEVYGNSVQEGTPTPENPIEVQSVGEKSVNLWDKENYILDTGNERSMLRYLYPKDYSWLKKGETFTISATIFVSENDTRTNMRLSIEMLGTDSKIYNNVKTHYSTKGEEIRVSLTYTIPQLDVDINRIYIRFIDYSTNTENVWDAYVKDIQIELGATARPYEPYGKYKIPVVQRGINLFKPTIVSATASLSAYITPSISNSYGTTIDSTDLTNNKVVVTQANYENATIDSYRNGFFGIRLPDELIYGIKYIVSFNLDIISNPLDAKNFIFISGSGKYYSSYLVDTPNGKRVVCSFIHSSKGSAYEPFLEIRNCGMSFIASNFMITEDGYEADYEPYIEPITTNIFLNEPLRKIGDYADYIDGKGNKVFRGIYRQTYTGKENWIKSGVFNNTDVFRLDNAVPYIVVHPLSIRSNYLVPRWQVEDNDWAVGEVRFQSQNYLQSTKRIYMSLGVSTVEELKEFLTTKYNEGNPLYIEYPMAEPTEEPISTVLSKLNAKTTIIEVDTSLAPSDAYGKYIKK